MTARSRLDFFAAADQHALALIRIVSGTNKKNAAAQTKAHAALHVTAPADENAMRDRLLLTVRCETIAGCGGDDLAPEVAERRPGRLQRARGVGRLERGVEREPLSHGADKSTPFHASLGR